MDILLFCKCGMSCSDFTETCYQEEVNISVPCKEQDKKIYSITVRYLHCFFLFKMQMVKLRIENIDTAEYNTAFSGHPT